MERNWVGENQWCKGRPSTFSTCDANRLKRIIKTNVGASTDHIFRTFLAENPTKFSKSTIYRQLINLRKYCPNAKFFVSPILPTRIRALNTKALQFNYTMFACVNPFWRVIDFSSFLDDDNLLDTNYCRNQKISTGYKDRIHLGYLGISKLAQIFKDSILKLYTFSSFTYASTLKPRTEVFNTPVS